MKSWLTACVLASLAAPAAAQFDLFKWNYTPGGGMGSQGSVGASTMYVGAGFEDPSGFQGFKTTAPVAGTVDVTIDYYLTWDGFCNASIPVFSEDGVLTTLATCSVWDQAYEFEVAAGSEFGFGLKTNVVNWPGVVGFVEFRFSPADNFSYWTDLGNGMGGTLGPPILVGQGLLHGGMPIKLKVTNAVPHVAATLVIGLSALDAPFKGGVMVPTVDVLIPGMSTDTIGALQLGTAWPPNLPPGLEVWMQAWVVDLTAAFGLSASNGLRATTP